MSTIEFNRIGDFIQITKDNDKSVGYLDSFDGKWKFGQQDEDVYLDEGDLRAILYKLTEINRAPVVYENHDIGIPTSVEELVQEYIEAKRNKDFHRTDQIRYELKEQGISLNDTGNGVRWAELSKRAE